MKDNDDSIVNQNELEHEPEIDTDPGDDVVFEDNTEVTGIDAKQKVDKLRARIKELEKKNTELLDAWQRDKAEFINARKRDEASQKDYLKFAHEKLLADLIPALDSFAMAMSNKEAWEKVDPNWRTGVEYIYAQLIGVLGQYGLTIINPKGERFDPEKAEAIENISVETHDQDDIILGVVQVGYALHGKIIRPAKVKVGHFHSA